MYSVYLCMHRAVDCLFTVFGPNNKYKKSQGMYLSDMGGGGGGGGDMGGSLLPLCQSLKKKIVVGESMSEYISCICMLINL